MFNTNLCIFLLIFFSILLPFIYKTIISEETKKNWFWYYLELFCYYTGLKYIFRKFFPTEKNVLPTGWVWLLGLYFAAYAFTAQRYESRLDKIEFRYNIFTTQLAAAVPFSNKILMEILNKKIPVKPNILRPLSIIQSFDDYHFSKQFFYSYDYTTADDFRQEIISQWADRLDSANFNHAKLNNTNFKYAKLNNANFHSAALEGAEFNGAELEGATLYQAKLNGANFREAKLNKAILAGAELNKVNFWFAELKKAIFKNAKLNGAIFNSTKLEEAEFWDAELEGANFEHASMNGATFYRAKLEGTIFRYAKLNGTKFRDAELEGVDLGGTELEGANFRNVKLNRASFNGAKSNRAKFKNAKLNKADFTGAKLEKTDFDGAKLNGAKFYRAELKGANLGYATLNRVIFWDADLEGVKFYFAKSLTAIDLLVAKNIYGIKGCTTMILNDIDQYGCKEMLKKRPDEWSDDLKIRLKDIRDQWLLKKKSSN